MISPLPVLFTYKVNTNSGDITFGVSVICKTKQKTRLAYTRVSNQQELKEVIAIYFCF